MHTEEPTVFRFDKTSKDRSLTFAIDKGGNDMKKLALILTLLFSVSLFAGEGKHCDMTKAKAAKKVTLTGKLVQDGDKAILKVADNKSYDVCAKSKRISPNSAA